MPRGPIEPEMNKSGIDMASAFIAFTGDGARSLADIPLHRGITQSCGMFRERSSGAKKYVAASSRRVSAKAEPRRPDPAGRRRSRATPRRSARARRRDPAPKHPARGSGHVEWLPPTGEGSMVESAAHAEAAARPTEEKSEAPGCERPPRDRSARRSSAAGVYGLHTQPTRVYGLRRDERPQGAQRPPVQKGPPKWVNWKPLALRAAVGGGFSVASPRPSRIRSRR